MGRERERRCAIDGEGMCSVVRERGCAVSVGSICGLQGE